MKIFSLDDNIHISHHGVVADSQSAEHQHPVGELLEADECLGEARLVSLRDADGLGVLEPEVEADEDVGDGEVEDGHEDQHPDLLRVAQPSVVLVLLSSGQIGHQVVGNFVL